MLAGLELVVPLANLLFDFLHHQIDGGIQINFPILGVKIRAAHTEAQMGVCRPYRGGPDSVACPMGYTCQKLSMTSMVPLATIGICGK